MENTKIQSIDDQLKNCKSVKELMGKDGLIKRIIKDTLERMLKAELDEHLGYEKNESAEGTENYRNGKSSKTVRSSLGEIEINIPRDRNGSFEPQVLKKHNREITEFDEKIISMYAKGMTTRDIQEHVHDIYGVDISPMMVSIITDKVEHLVIEWQNRPLAPTYAVIYFDAIFYKVRDNGKVVTKAVYSALGIDMEGKKDLLGLWVGESEGARFWAAICNELKARGVKDILIACMDGLKGMPDVLKSSFPEVNVQLCIVHMIRNSLKYVSSKKQKDFLIDLKLIYQSATEMAASLALDNLKRKWQKAYPLAVNPWVNHWENVSTYFKYPPDLRRMIYTTNAVEALHRQFRKVTKNRSIMPNDGALLKLLFLAARDIQKKWTTTAKNWGDIISQLHIIFGDRIMVN